MDTLTPILLADAEPEFLEVATRALHRQKRRFIVATSSAECKQLLDSQRFGLLIADTCMPGNCNLEVARYARENMPEMSVIIVTKYPSIETAIAAVELSVEAYLIKPISDDELRPHVIRGLERSAAGRTIKRVEQQLQYCAEQTANLQIQNFGTAERLGHKGFDVPLSLLQTLSACLAELTELAAPGGQIDRASLCELLRCPAWTGRRRAIYRAVELLQETKRRFKSKELAKVREILEQLLLDDHATRTPRDPANDNHRVA